tara:strand:- start:6847 stop:8046 length:1200 start_codon:yes stop_codon:yes gene_type:complete
MKINSKLLLTIIIISFAICPAFAFNEESKNLFLLGVMLSTPFIILHYRDFNKNDSILLLFIASILLIPLLFFFKETRWSTVLYSVGFCFTHIAFKQLLRRKTFSIYDYEKILKYLLYAYFIVLVIQQFSVLTGLPIFNVRFYRPNEPWKLNSLGGEPSWAARTIGLMMYCYITINEIISSRKYNFQINFKRDKRIWIGFLYSMLTLGSSTAIFFLAVFSLKFIGFKNKFRTAVVFILVITFFNFVQIDSVQRVLKTTLATFTLDQNAIIEADGSASARIVPFIVMLENIDLYNFKSLITGHGVDYVKNNIIVENFEGITLGGFLVILKEYGLISFVLITLFTLSATISRNDFLLTLILWFTLIFSYGLNVQIPWLAIMLLFLNKHYHYHFQKYKKFNVK